MLVHCGVLMRCVIRTELLLIIDNHTEDKNKLTGMCLLHSSSIHHALTSHIYIPTPGLNSRTVSFHYVYVSEFFVSI